MAVSKFPDTFSSRLLGNFHQRLSITAGATPTNPDVQPSGFFINTLWNVPPKKKKPTKSGFLRK